jgi:2-polyprenyl-3-methyl-5-hydroxy-6-metoxy-1,4-benzoquinol methylase
MKNNITELIKKQYTVYPYPPIPVGDLEEEVLYSTNYEFVKYLCTGVFKSHKEIKILDVGCGTGFSTLKIAQQNPEALITAIDLSPTSITIAEDRLRKAGILMDNIKFITADLMMLEDINDRFDYIVCTGVLHHLESPEKGLDFLKLHLTSDGIIYLMLYSEYGRFFQSLVSKTIKILQNNQQDFSEGIAIGKQFLKTLPESHPILSRYNRSYEAAVNVINQDFANSDSQFIDAYMNANERTYNIDELFDFIEKADLSFIRFQDEARWDLNYLLKSDEYLISKTTKLTNREKYKLGEIIDSEKNFAFFVSKNKFEKSEISDSDLYTYKVKFIKLSIINIDKENNLKIISPLGLTLYLEGEEALLYNHIKDNLTIGDNINLIIKFKNLFSKNAITNFKTLIRDLEYNGVIMFLK